MIHLLAMTASEAFDTPALCGLAGASVMAIDSHLRRRRDQKIIFGE